MCFFKFCRDRSWQDSGLLASPLEHFMQWYNEYPTVSLGPTYLKKL